MRIALTIIFFVTFISNTKAQMITFKKNVYKVGEHVRVTVIGNLTGIENDITNSSYSSADGELDLNAATAPGFYRVNFKFAGGVTVPYLIGIIKPEDNSSEDYNIALDGGLIPSITPTLADKMWNYFKNEVNTQQILNVSKDGIVKFGKENAVSVVLNASFCITVVSGVPVVTVICKSMTKSNLQKMGLEILKSFLLDMKSKNYLTDSEYQKILNVIAVGQIGSILKNNCSIIFKSLNTKIENPDLKLAIGYMEQQCKATVLIIEKVKIP